MSLSPKKYIEFKYNFQLIFDEQLQTMISNKYYFIISYLVNNIIFMIQYKKETDLKKEFDKYITESLVKYSNPCTELMRIIRDYLLEKYNDEYNDDESRFVEDLKKTLFEGEYKVNDYRFGERALPKDIQNFNLHLNKDKHYHRFFSGLFGKLESYFQQKNTKIHRNL